MTRTPWPSPARFLRIFPAPRSFPLNREAPQDPAYDPAELYGVIPHDTRVPYDVHEVIARLVDGSRLHEFKPRYSQPS